MSTVYASECVFGVIILHSHEPHAEMVNEASTAKYELAEIERG